MEFRELTSSLLNFWGLGCAEHILDSRDYMTFIRRRNHWVNRNLSRGLSGIIVFDWSRIIAFSLEIPIDIAPLPILGNNIVVVLCHWVAPPIANPNRKRMLIENVVDRMKSRGFSGMSLVCPHKLELPLFESMGFLTVSQIDCICPNSFLLFLNLNGGEPPVVKQPPPIPPPKKRTFALDVFYPEFCPIGTVLLNRILRQIASVSSLVELRVHDTSTRRVVLELGRTLGCYLNGENISSKILLGVPLKQIISEAKREHPT